MKIYFIRHGQTDYNKKMIIQGSGIDSDLNDTGREQANLFFKAYQDVPFEVVLTSKLKRSIQTAQQFIDLPLPHESFAEINEIGWGVHEGVGGDPKLRDTYKWLIGEWSSGNLDARVPEGESAAEMMERCNRFINHLKTRKEETILVCSHGRTLRCLVTLLKGETMDRMEAYKHTNTGLYLFEYDGEQFSCLEENNSAHLN